MKRLLFLAFFLLCIMAPAASSEQAGKKNRQNETLVKNFIEALNAKDMDKLVSLFSDDGTYEEVCSGRFHTGKKAISAYITSTLEGIPDTNFELVSVSCSADRAMFEWIWKGTNSVGWPSMHLPPTNKYFELKGVSVMDIENGRIRANRDYWDWNSFLKGISVK
jgi:steroid delta-isomerase-like uncharacterized protein